MDNKYKDWIDMVKACHNALFMALLAQIANLLYSYFGKNNDESNLYLIICLYIGCFLTFCAWVACYKLVSLLRRKGG